MKKFGRVAGLATISKSLRITGFIDEEGQITNRFKDEFGPLLAVEEELEKERKKIYRNAQ